MLKKLEEQIRSAVSRWQVVLYDGLMVVIAWFLAYWFRFNLDVIPQAFFDQAIRLLPLVVLIHVGALIVSRVYRVPWLFTSTRDIFVITRSVFSGLAVIWILNFLMSFLFRVPFYGQAALPIGILHAVLLIGLLMTSRLLYRAYQTRKQYI